MSTSLGRGTATLTCPFAEMERKLPHSREQLLVFNSDHLNACKRNELIDCSGFLKVQVEDKGWDSVGHSRKETAEQPPTAEPPPGLPVLTPPSWDFLLALVPHPRSAPVTGNPSMLTHMACQSL